MKYSMRALVAMRVWLLALAGLSCTLLFPSGNAQAAHDCGYLGDGHVIGDNIGRCTDNLDGVKDCSGSVLEQAECIAIIGLGLAVEAAQGLSAWFLENANDVRCGVIGGEDCE